MTYFIGVVVLILALIISVAIHELGHMIPAKKFGAVVPRYMVGFGPTLWSRTIGETEYGIKAILLGGYVRILGMYAPAKPTTIVAKLAGKKLNLAQLEELRQSDPEAASQAKLTVAQEAREVSDEEISPSLRDRSFYKLSVPKKIIVMFGGPVTNLIISIVCIAIAMGAIGVQAPSTTLQDVPRCLLAGVEKQECDATEEGPAYVAGLRAGDKILSWNGKSISTWAEITETIATSGTDSVPVVVERDGKELTFQVSPRKLDNGQIKAGMVSEIERTRFSIGDISGQVWLMFWGTVKIIVALPQALWTAGKGLVGGKPRDPNGVVSVVGVGQIAGQIASSPNPKVVFADQAAAMLGLVSSLNMALFVFNLIPLLPLDGGHIASALYEGLRRRWNLMRGRPDPGPVDTARSLPLTYTVVGFLLVMTVFLVILDFVNPISL